MFVSPGYMDLTFITRYTSSLLDERVDELDKRCVARLPADCVARRSAVDSLPDASISARKSGDHAALEAWRPASFSADGFTRQR
jgi:hypothetical protein